MAGYKETPRQKMIAMMYLVLTALLALNVSKQMLDAFLVVNESMESTVENFDGKIEDVYHEFGKQFQLNQNKVGPYKLKADTAKSLTEEMVRYIDSVKYALIIRSEGKRRIPDVETAKNTPLKELKTKDKYTEPTRYFFARSEDGTKGESGKLRRKIDAYRTKMLQLMNEPENSDRLGLITDGVYYDASGSPQNWMQHNFYYTILAADITILNKLIGEIRSAQFDVVSYLFSDITAEDFKFDKVSAEVISQNSYILQGQTYEPKILVAATDSKQSPKVYYVEGTDKITNGDGEIIDAYKNKARIAKERENGDVYLELRNKGVGSHDYAGWVEMSDPITGKTKNYNFKGSYVVAPPSLTVAATKMNVFYIGVENPVSISVPGIASENIKPGITQGCNLTQDPNGVDWIVTVPKGIRTATISAKAKMGENDWQDMGSREFRVKRVPDPVAEIAGYKEGTIDRNTLLAANAIIPVMKDFEFDLNFVVNSFTMGTIINGDWIPKTTQGNRFSAEMANLIRNSRRGQKFFFENIQASGPDGTTRTLNAISLTIQ